MEAQNILDYVLNAKRKMLSTGLKYHKQKGRESATFNKGRVHD